MTRHAQGSVSLSATFEPNMSISCSGTQVLPLTSAVPVTEQYRRDLRRKCRSAWSSINVTSPKTAESRPLHELEATFTGTLTSWGTGSVCVYILYVSWQGRSGSSQSTIAEVMALLGQKLKAMPPTDSDAVPLLNEAWQVCFAHEREVARGRVLVSPFFSSLCLCTR